MVEAVMIEPYTPHQPVSTPPGFSVVLVGGCFDILHRGHFVFLEKARQRGDYLVVALEPDQHILERKNRPPIHTHMQRAQNLSAIRYVDKVLLLGPLKGFQAYLQLVKDVRPSVIAITAHDPQMESMWKQAKVIGAHVQIVTERMEPLSSTEIYKRLAAS
jgi:cytidyltransferase-like protein